MELVNENEQLADLVDTAFEYGEMALGQVALEVDQIELQLDTTELLAEMTEPLIEMTELLAVMTGPKDEMYITSCLELCCFVEVFFFYLLFELEMMLTWLIVLAR